MEYNQRLFNMMIFLGGKAKLAVYTSDGCVFGVYRRMGITTPFRHLTFTPIKSGLEFLQHEYMFSMSDY